MKASLSYGAGAVRSFLELYGAFCLCTLLRLEKKQLLHLHLFVDHSQVIAVAGASSALNFSISANARPS